MSAIAFVIYPFHQEAIVWAVGRASLLAGFFGLLAIVIAFSHSSLWSRIFLTNLCYFVALSGYESVAMLPLITIVLLFKKHQSLKIYLLWLVSFTVTLAAHSMMRLHFSGFVFGNYEQDAFHGRTLIYAINFGKSVCRLFVAPIYNEIVFIVASVIILLIALLLAYSAMSNRTNESKAILWRFSFVILLTLIVPTLFNLSIKTSEGDRLLFWPSVFLVILLSYILSSLTSRKAFLATTSIVVVYFLASDFVGLSHWKKAASIVAATLDFSKRQTNPKKTIILNMPDSYYGAFIFRKGFKESLLLNNIDTSKIDYFAGFMMWDYDKAPDTLKALCNDHQVHLDSYATISRDTTGGKFLFSTEKSLNIIDTSKETIWYWNKHDMMELDLTCRGRQ